MTVRDELAFLDGTDARVPDVLPSACDALVRRLQLEVICRELPDVAAAVTDDLVAGARGDSTGATLARRLGFGERGRSATPAAASPADLVRLFVTHRVGAERLEDEVGSDLFTRTVSHAVTVAHSAATGARSGLGVLGALLKSVKLPVYVFYLLANRLRDDSRTAAAVTTSLLIAGLVAVVASALVTNGGAAIAALGWALLIDGSGPRWSADASPPWPWAGSDRCTRLDAPSRLASCRRACGADDGRALLRTRMARRGALRAGGCLDHYRATGPVGNRRYSLRRCAALPALHAGRRREAGAALRLANRAHAPARSYGHARTAPQRTPSALTRLSPSVFPNDRFVLALTRLLGVK